LVLCCPRDSAPAADAAPLDKPGAIR